MISSNSFLKKGHNLKKNIFNTYVKNTKGDKNKSYKFIKEYIFLENINF